MPLYINFFIIESGIAMCRKKKFVCVYLLQVGQALAMRCRCRAPDFDITGRNTKSDICLLKKFSLCAVYMRKDMRLSRSSNYVYIIYITLYKYMCVYIYTHVSRVSLCIHAFGMTLIGARETQFAVTFLEADVDSCELDDVALRVRPSEPRASSRRSLSRSNPSLPFPVCI